MVGGRELCIKQTFCQARGGAVIDTVPELGSTNQRFFGTRMAIWMYLGDGRTWAAGWRAGRGIRSNEQYVRWTVSHTQQNRKAQNQTSGKC